MLNKEQLELAPAIWPERLLINLVTEIHRDAVLESHVLGDRTMYRVNVNPKFGVVTMHCETPYEAWFEASTGKYNS